MKNSFAEITEHGVTIHGGKHDDTFFALPLANDAHCRLSRVVLLANTKQAIFRIAKSDEQHDKWQLVKSAFPIGEKLNADTHIFDGVEVTNTIGDKCFLMTALPKHYANELASIGSKLFGIRNLQCLDTVEHMLFQQYAAQGTGLLWVVFPQGDGIRILSIYNGLPVAAYNISNHAEYREAELMQYLNDKKTAPNRAVILSNKLDWFCATIESQDVTAEVKDYKINFARG